MGAVKLGLLKGTEPYLPLAVDPPYTYSPQSGAMLWRSARSRPIRTIAAFLHAGSQDA
jgi:hypothetical protein